MREVITGSVNKTKNILKKSIAKKITITSIVGATLVLGTAYADSGGEHLSNVYHVYVDDELIGTVADEEDIQQYINEWAEEEQEKEGDGVTLVPSQEVEFIEEFVFSANTDQEEVVDALEEQLTFDAAAIELRANDEIIGYVKNLDEANQAVNQVISQYLPDGVDEEISLLEEELEEMIGHSAELVDLLPQNMFQTGNINSTLEEEDGLYYQQTIELDGSTVLDVGFTENVTFSEVAVDSSKLLNVDQLAKMIERGTMTQQIHEIQDNEALSTVASDYDLSVDELIEINPDVEEDSVIRVGDELNVTGLSSLIEVAYTETITEEESIEYETITEQTDSLYEGESEVEQSGSDGLKELKYEVTMNNGEELERNLVEEEVIEEPRDEIIKEGTKVISSRGTGDFAWPAVGGTLTSTYGPRWGSHHDGIDIAGVSDRSILAADNGVVVEAGYHSGGHGNRVIIDHNNGYRTLYAHLSSIDVNVGETVKQGSTIGQMGSTGRSTGVHLHFEVEKNGQTVDPGPYIR
ncbi:M23 family metallopeptidase [Alkalibacillus haloalkaliphilus]|uniref:M23 family metallopeptidase n=1 Tax=Alkalibacillus haloalkaliphilus TaxID=94136 RepID=UPI002936181B|nr:M23 family metallopeptidase [Alkalibacillus haloalkaliphilus]MDV2581567.1 M23 family metallopeptidase [Alkalibacillus haloalkaliphilus]